MIALTDAGVVFVVAAAALVAAAILLGSVRVDGRIELGGGEDGGPWRMVRTGLRFVGRDADARLLVGMVAAQTFVRGCLNVLIVVAAFGCSTQARARSAT